MGNGIRFINNADYSRGFEQYAHPERKVTHRKYADDNKYIERGVKFDENGELDRSWQKLTDGERSFKHILNYTDDNGDRVEREDRPGRRDNKPERDNEGHDRAERGRGKRRGGGRIAQLLEKLIDMISGVIGNNSNNSSTSQPENIDTPPANNNNGSQQPYNTGTPPVSNGSGWGQIGDIFNGLFSGLFTGGREQSQNPTPPSELNYNYFDLRNNGSNPFTTQSTPMYYGYTTPTNTQSTIFGNSIVPPVYYY